MSKRLESLVEREVADRIGRTQQLMEDYFLKGNRYEILLKEAAANLPDGDLRTRIETALQGN